MLVEVRRKIETTKSIIGELFVDGQHECSTLEPARVSPVHVGHPAIPAGEYPLYLTFSPRFQIVTPEVMDVPHRSDIRLHVGNFPKDTLGCILVGESHGEDTVIASKVAFEKLMTLLKTATNRTMIIVRDPEVD
jgi:hypothetical protein